MIAKFIRILITFFMTLYGATSNAAEYEECAAYLNLGTYRWVDHFLVERYLREKTPDISNVVEPNILDIPVSQIDDHVISIAARNLDTCIGARKNITAMNLSGVPDFEKNFRFVAEELRKRYNFAVAISKQNQLSNDLSLSCVGLVEGLREYQPYAEKKMRFVPIDFDSLVYGKLFGEYASKDFEVIGHLIESCRPVYQEGAALDMLQKDVLSKFDLLSDGFSHWGVAQQSAIELRNKELEQRAKDEAVAAERKRRQENPTFIERSGDFLGKVGMVGIGLFSLLWVRDRRFKSGFKNNNEPPAWAVVGVGISFLFVFLGSFLA